MRFRARVEIWLEASELNQAEEAAAAMERAAFAAVGPAAVRHPKDGGLTRTELEPMNERAIAALAVENWRTWGPE